MPERTAPHRNMIIGGNFKITYTSFNIFGDFVSGNCNENITFKNIKLKTVLLYYSSSFLNVLNNSPLIFYN